MPESIGEHFISSALPSIIYKYMQMVDMYIWFELDLLYLAN